MYSEINSEAALIADRLDLGDRMDSLARSEAFLTLKDHKTNFANALPCRLINPAKPELGIVSKQILDCIVGKLRESTNVNLWKNTASVIDWFETIKGKRNQSFLCFDIVDFYPSISEDLLQDALRFARTHVNITDNEMEVIFHARKSLLFSSGSAWVRRGKQEGLFDVPMGSYDGAEICELVGVFLLSELAEFLAKDSIGLYRDDGLAAIPGSGHDADTARKRIISVFKRHGLRITVETNLRTVNFLDVTFNLDTGKYYPYRKPNDRPLYIHKNSNHPPQIIRNLPTAISKRVSGISSDQDVFSAAAPLYNDALAASGYQEKIEFTETKTPSKACRRHRNITWFNPPFSKNVATNVGRAFLRLISKHFPKSSTLAKIFNKNTVKVSYSCMPNMANIIRRSNNQKRAGSQNARVMKPCNSRQKDSCPLNGKCQAESIVYQATVQDSSSGSDKVYIGLSEPPFKLRYANHLTSFRHEKYSSGTELSKHVWALKHQNTDFAVKWSICDRASAYNNISKRCGLCATEKWRIITTDKSRRLNTRSEIVSKCRHANKFLISNFIPNG